MPSFHPVKQFLQSVSGEVGAGPANPGMAAGDSGVMALEFGVPARPLRGSRMRVMPGDTASSAIFVQPSLIEPNVGVGSVRDVEAAFCRTQAHGRTTAAIMNYLRVTSSLQAHMRYGL